MSIFKDKVLLISGGTGSFGNAVLRRFLRTDIGEIRIFSRDEKKQDDMRHEYQAKFPDVAHKIKFYIGDVRDLNSCKSAMNNVDFVFHAAALKQVPSCEFFPMQAVYTNVIGTDNILTAAIDAKVKAVICLSTDKAAYPINAMGITKAIEEKVAVAKSRYSGDTMIACTRYGNVLCSRGSVVPLWISQIKEGNPITITEPKMTRFIMSLDEALLTNEECAKAIDEGNFYRVPADNRDLNYDKYFTDGNVQRNVLTEFNSDNTTRLNVEQVKEKLLSLEYIQNELKGIENIA